MIIFDLSCKQGHPFEGWFQSAATYDGQLAGGLISCPHCGSIDVRRLPSAVHLAKPVNTPLASGVQTKIASKGGMPAAYQQLISMIVAHSEDVGMDFADEARRIHYFEAPERSIRGQASAEDYETLREEGIDVMRLALPKKEHLN